MKDAAVTDWLYAKDIARELAVSRSAAVRWLHKIPGAVLMYEYEGRSGGRRRVSRENYEKWLKARRKRGSTKSTKLTGGIPGR